MAEPGTIRRSGVLEDWDDQRGFGFIVPSDASRRVFVHVSEFPPDASRPSDGDELSFVIGAGRDGRRQALAIEVIHSARRARELDPAGTRRRAPIRWLPLSVVPVFAVLFVLVAAYWRMPLWAILLYPLMSVATFALYHLDKAAAVGRGWRTRETTLQLAALLGGWPGAVVAQQVLRHKNRKPAFQAAFWCIVVLNVAILLIVVWYQGPMAEFFRRAGEWLAGG